MTLHESNLISKQFLGNIYTLHLNSVSHTDKHTLRPGVHSCEVSFSRHSLFINTGLHLFSIPNSHTRSTGSLERSTSLSAEERQR